MCPLFWKGLKMKDINNLKNYREKYKRYYGIDFGKEYAIHHIDLDRSNNDISNLLLLPKELHAKYHMILNAISICPDKPKADGFIDVRISNAIITEYNAKMFELLPETIAECNKWLRWKYERYSEAARKVIFERR
jgi:hypothetical protein